jgi:hypothetical protein
LNDHEADLLQRQPCAEKEPGGRQGLKSI